MRQAVKLFLNGRSQAVRLPARFRFKKTDRVYIEQLETGDLLLSKKAGGWDEFFNLCDAMSQKELVGFMDERDQSPPQTRNLF